MINISIVIPAYNEGQNVAFTLESILECTSHPDFEILLVDDGSNDGSHNFLNNNRYHQNPRIRLISNEQSVGCIKARHQGVQMSRGENIVFLDAHMALSPGWLEILTRSLERWGPMAIISAEMSILDEDRWSSCEATEQVMSFDEKFDLIWSPPVYPSRIVPIVGGSCVIINRNFYDQIGGFDLNLRRWGCEFIDLSLKVYEAGGVCFHEPEVVVGHLFREKTPFELSYADLNYNKLRTAYIHLDDTTFLYLLHNLSTEPEFATSWEYFQNDLPEIIRLRTSTLESSIRPRDWFARMFLGDWQGKALKYHLNNEEEIIRLTKMGLTLDPVNANHSMFTNKTYPIGDNADLFRNPNRITMEGAMLPDMNMHSVCTSCGATSFGELDTCLFCHTSLTPIMPQYLIQTCANCHTLVPTSHNFCPECGRALARPDFPDIKLCSKCGAQMTADKLFCTQCGNRLQQ